MVIGDFIRNKVNLNEFSYDSALLIFPFILGRVYDPVIKARVFGIPFSQFFLMLAVYFLPLLIGRMYHNVFRDSSQLIKKAVIAILFAVAAFAYGNLLYLVISSGDDLLIRGMFIIIAATVLIIMGPIAGLAFNEYENKEKSGEDNHPVQVYLFLFTAGILPLFYLLMTAKEIFGDINEILLFIIVCALCVGDVILIMVLMAGFFLLRRTLKGTVVYDTASSVFRLLIPFCVSFIMVFFNIYTDRLFLGSAGIHGTGSVIILIVMYTATGVLPLRVIMMIAPPVRIINIVIGILSSVLMIWSVSLH